MNFRGKASTYKDLAKSAINNFKKSGPEAQLKTVVQGIGLAGLGSYAAGSIKAHTVDPLASMVSIARSKNKMLELTPSLQDEDQDKVNNYFNVVKKFSPKAASNPLVAGALVNKMVQFGGVDHKLVQDLASINKDINPQRESSKGEFMKNTIKAIGEL